MYTNDSEDDYVCVGGEGRKKERKRGSDKRPGKIEKSTTR